MVILVHVVCFPERHNHARELVRDADLSQWDAFVIMSGDGLLFEVKSDTHTTGCEYAHCTKSNPDLLFSSLPK